MSDLISLRLSHELAVKLAREARHARRPKSEIAREAIDAYLSRQERDRLLAEIARAARARGKKEALAIAAEALPLDNEATELAEGRAGVSTSRSPAGSRTRAP